MARVCFLWLVSRQCHNILTILPLSPGPSRNRAGAIHAHGSSMPNDINGELVNMYRVVQHHLEECVRQFKWALTSRKIFEWEQMKLPETLTGIQRTARFFYLQKNCFGGKVDGQHFGYATTAGPKFNLMRIEEDLSTVHIRLAGAYIERLPWDKCIAKYDRKHTLQRAGNSKKTGELLIYNWS